MQASVCCLDCGAVIAETVETVGSKPCTACGSRRREVAFDIKDKMAMLHDKLDVIARKPGTKKPVRELRVGDDLHRDSGKWNHLERLIDREGDLYRKVITDPETGKAIHFCEEPLSKHTGHGSAKPRAGEGTP